MCRRRPNLAACRLWTVPSLASGSTPAVSVAVRQALRGRATFIARCARCGAVLILRYKRVSY
eukprot:6202501-Pleurochrysis_carterae.AAC.1